MAHNLSTGTCFNLPTYINYFEYWYRFQASDLWHLFRALVHVSSFRLMAPISSTGTCFKLPTYSTYFEYWFMFQASDL